MEGCPGLGFAGPYRRRLGLIGGGAEVRKGAALATLVLRIPTPDKPPRLGYFAALKPKANRLGVTL